MSTQNRIYDPLAEGKANNDVSNKTPREPYIRFFSPIELRDYKQPENLVLVGDGHILRGEVAVLGGQTHVGKSTGATDLAVAGATKDNWFGLPIHHAFKTLIVQTENGRYRLMKEYLKRECAAINDYILVSEPPPFGLKFNHPDFREDLQATINSFKPDLVVLDPLNAATKDDTQKDYAATFETLIEILPKGKDKPALLIVAHTRKPSANERQSKGRSLMHLLAGSYMLASVPRCIFMMLNASDDETDDEVVFYNLKNSNGDCVPRSAWKRENGLFIPITEFDWDEFDKPQENRKSVTLEHLQLVFKDGAKLEKKRAVERLCEIAKIKPATAYKALDTKKGKFRDFISEEQAFLSLRT